MAVIFYHAGITRISGGFLGVDVFFVISGFLITSLAMGEYEKTGTLNIGRFFLRRTLRILPALLAVVLCCICLSVVLAPVASLEFYETVLSIPFFMSNIVLYSQSGYFSGAVNEKLLLHTWSLAVEEQFYIIFPFSFLVLIRFRNIKMLACCISLMLILSFLVATLTSFNSPNISFFSMPTRLWELLSGSLTAIIFRIYKVRPNNLFALIGFGSLLIAFFLFNKGIVHPGPLTVVPVIGTCFLILYTTGSSGIGRILSSRFLSWFGLISYSLYLWHVPIFSFFSFFVETQNGLMTVISIILTILVSFFSYHWIEVPFRNDKNFPKSRFGFMIFGGMILVLVLGILGVATKGFYKLRYNDETHDIVETLFDDHSKYVRKNFQKFQKIDWDRDGTKPNLLIIGDSYAQDLTNILIEASLDEHYEIRTFRVGAKCGNLFVPKQKLEAFQSSRTKIPCSKQSLVENPSVKELLLRADIVILSSQWKDWHVDQMSESITYFNEHYGSTLLVVGSKLFPKPNIKVLEKIEPESRNNLFLLVNRDIQELNKKLKAIVVEKNAYYFDIQEEFCSSTEKGCSLYDSIGRLKSYDGKHLTQDGAKFLAPSLKKYIMIDVK